MSLKRLAVLQPEANVDTLLTSVNTQYFASVIMTNINQDQTANITIYIKPHESVSPTEYAYVLYNFPLDRANSLETHRFAMNPLDEIWIESSIAGVSFVAEGIPQPLISVRYSSGETANQPASPIAGDLFYDTTQNLLFLYKPTGWKQVTTA